MIRRAVVIAIPCWVAVIAMVVFAFAQDKPQVLPEVDRLKAYALELKDSRDRLEGQVADLKLYAQRLERQVQDLQKRCPEK